MGGTQPERRRWRRCSLPLVVVGLALVSGAVYSVAFSIGWVLALVVNVIVLFLALGFRQFSHRGTEIQIALANGDLAALAANSLYGSSGWIPPAAADLDQDEVVRQAIEHGLLLAQRHVLACSSGCAVARSGERCSTASRTCRTRVEHATAKTPPDQFGDFARQAFAWIDWAPARLTALGFAIVGDFEGAIYCWRQVSRELSVDGTPAPDSRTLILAAASGAAPAADAGRGGRASFDEPGNGALAGGAFTPALRPSSGGLAHAAAVARLLRLTLAAGLPEDGASSWANSA
jgi:adenosylcobinamide-phosphate synthase